MPRLISCAETIPAVLDRTKTETRRLGWWCDRNGRRLVKPGDRLIVCGKVMGRKADEPLRRLAEVEVTDVRREPLVEITDGAVWAEGCVEIVTDWLMSIHDPWIASRLAAYTPIGEQFTWWYSMKFGCPLNTEVTVIQWRYLVSYEGPYAEAAA